MRNIILKIFCLCCFSLSFIAGHCGEQSSWWELLYDIQYLHLGIQYNGYNANETVFGIGIGNNGLIVKSLGADTINLIPKNSGTTQNLNGLKIQPTSFQPLVIAVGDNGTITRSTDQGDTWILSSLITTSNLFASDITSTVQYCAGDNGVIMISYNLGANWTLQTSGVTRNLRGIGTNGGGGNVVAVGEKGTILRTTNTGLNWINLSIPDTTINFYCVSQKTRQNFNATNYYIAGSQGRIYKSTDNGATWVLKNSGTTNTLRSIFFSGNDSGAVSGDNGTVRITTNAGETWFSDPYFQNVTGKITSISHMPRSSRTFTALSNNNKLYITSEDTSLVVIGIKIISNEIPKEFTLLQNYPNPFNPETNIQFQIKQSADVKIVIYDVNGREVEIIVNKRLSAGTYSADWNAAYYSSGVYFCRMTAGDYVQTNKMILNK